MLERPPREPGALLIFKPNRSSRKPRRIEVRRLANLLIPEDGPEPATRGSRAENTRDVGGDAAAPQRFSQHATRQPAAMAHAEPHDVRDGSTDIRVAHRRLVLERAFEIR